MRFTAKRLLAAGAIGISAIVTPIGLSVALSGVAGVGPSSVASAQGPFDELTYNQFASGSPLDTDQYVPANPPVTGPPGPQALNVSGNCATPPGNPSPPAVLEICGQLWPLNFTGTPSLANLGTNSQQGPATGVSAITPSWTIDTKSNKGSEAIDFSPGDPNVIGQSRAFTDAQIQVARKDTGNSGTTMVVVQLAEFSTSLPIQPNTNKLLGLQDCTINGNQGAQIQVDPDVCTADPNTPVLPPGVATAKNGAPLAFGTIEVRDATANSTAISVVGVNSATGQPTPATFELVNNACPGTPVPAQDPNNTGVSATLMLTGPLGGPCKTYTSFIATPPPPGSPPNTPATLSFNGFTTSNVRFTVQVTWPAVDLCSPYSDPGITDASGVVGGQPKDMCAVHTFELNGMQTFDDQAYCQNAQAPSTGPPATEPQQELCTVAKAYNNVVLNANGTPKLDPNDTTGALLGVTGPDGPGTQITETWAGYVDWLIH